MFTKKPSPKFLRSLLGAALLFAAACAAACSDNNTGSSPDLAAAGDMLPFSCCGHPGDTGNSMGIGQYCRSSADCTNSSAPLCGNDFEPQRHTYFCTTTCDPPDMGGTRGCGADATCTLDAVTHQYGCVPTACLTNMPAGCSN